jgi:hypothetical protein
MDPARREVGGESGMAELVESESTPLMWLPGDEGHPMEIAAVLSR